MAGLRGKKMNREPSVLDDRCATIVNVACRRKRAGDKSAKDWLRKGLEKNGQGW
ncbi:MAG: hypothetical protein LBH14_02500 [Desulfobulbaceae bacterium]|nr:hypothetical protein [Desulfobulbaceae bacterium]